MGQEIERKFRITDYSYLDLHVAKEDIKQGYLSTDPDRTVRLRQVGSAATKCMYITIKGISDDAGLSRAEFEQQWSADAQEQAQMMAMCTDMITKTRYIVDFFYSLDGNLLVKVEVDVFHGENEGLIVAEVEYKSVADSLELPRPDWFGNEVTGNSIYYNSKLTTYPYCRWSKIEKYN